jgi:hypothetical protein
MPTDADVSCAAVLSMDIQRGVVSVYVKSELISGSWVQGAVAAFMSVPSHYGLAGRLANRVQLTTDGRIRYLSAVEGGQDMWLVGRLHERRRNAP